MSHEEEEQNVNIDGIASSNHPPDNPLANTSPLEESSKTNPPNTPPNISGVMVVLDALSTPVFESISDPSDAEHTSGDSRDYSSEFDLGASDPPKETLKQESANATHSPERTNDTTQEERELLVHPHLTEELHEIWSQTKLRQEIMAELNDSRSIKGQRGGQHHSHNGDSAEESSSDASVKGSSSGVIATDELQCEDWSSAGQLDLDRLFMSIAHTPIPEWIHMCSESAVAEFMTKSAIESVNKSGLWKRIAKEDLVYNRLASINIEFHTCDETILSNYTPLATKSKSLDISFGIDEKKSPKARIKSLAYYTILLFTSFVMASSNSEGNWGGTQLPVIVLEKGKTEWISYFISFLCEPIAAVGCEKKPSIIIQDPIEPIDIRNIIGSVASRYIQSNEYLLSAIEIRKAKIVFDGESSFDAFYANASKFVVDGVIFKKCTITSKAAEAMGRTFVGTVSIMNLIETNIVNEKDEIVTQKEFERWLHRVASIYTLSKILKKEMMLFYGKIGENYRRDRDFREMNRIANPMRRELSHIKLVSCIGSEFFNRYPVYTKEGPFEAFDHIRDISYTPPENDVMRAERISIISSSRQPEVIVTRLLSSLSGAVETNCTGHAIRSMPIIHSGERKETEKPTKNKITDSPSSTKKVYVHSVDVMNYGRDLCIFRMPYMIRRLSLRKCNFFFINSLLQYMRHNENTLESLSLFECSLTGRIKENSKATPSDMSAITTLSSVYQAGCSLGELAMINCGLGPTHGSQLADLFSSMGITEDLGAETWSTLDTDKNLPACTLDLSSNKFTATMLGDIFMNRTPKKIRGRNPFRTKATRSLRLFDSSLDGIDSCMKTLSLNFNTICIESIAPLIE